MNQLGLTQVVIFHYFYLCLPIIRHGRIVADPVVIYCGVHQQCMVEQANSREPIAILAMKSLSCECTKPWTQGEV